MSSPSYIFWLILTNISWRQEMILSIDKLCIRRTRSVECGAHVGWIVNVCKEYFSRKIFARSPNFPSINGA